MLSTDIATLSRICVYPIKSMDAMHVAAVKVVAPGALADDRRWALFDEEGKVLNAKRDPRIQTLRSVFAPDLSEVSIAAFGENPQTFSLRDTKQLSRMLSEFFGYPVFLRENVDGGFPDDTQAYGPTVVPASTLTTVATWFEAMTPGESARRFRTNLELDGLPAFWEDGMLLKAGGKPFRIGDVDFQAVTVCQRCPVPARDSYSGEAHIGFQKRFVEHRRKNLPAWAVRERFNHFYRLTLNTVINSGSVGRELRVGDTLALLPGE